MYLFLYTAVANLLPALYFIPPVATLSRSVLNWGCAKSPSYERRHSLMYLFLYDPLYGRTSEAINAKFFAIKYVTGVLVIKIHVLFVYAVVAN